MGKVEKEEDKSKSSKKKPLYFQKLWSLHEEVLRVWNYITLLIHIILGNNYKYYSKNLQRSDPLYLLKITPNNQSQ